MKHLFLKSALIGSLSILGSMMLFAAEEPVQKIHHFTIIAPESTKVGEAIDVTVEARDSADKVIPTYKGTIFFLEVKTDASATLPSQGKTIEFTEVDKWVKKFSKGVIFKKTGEHQLEVADVIEDATGTKKIRVETADVPVSGSGDAITIITPENNMVMNMKDLVVISGYGKKNSKVNIKLNNADIGTVTTDDNWLYSKTLPSLTQQSNIVVADLLDGTNKIISSAQVRFTMTDNSPVFTNLTVAPSTSVEVSTPITLTVEAEPGLSEVAVNLDGSIVVLKEISSGKYSIETPAPIKAGTYPLSVTLKNSLSQGTSKANVANLTVTEKVIVPSKFINVKTVTEWTKVIFTFGVENIPTELSQFKIAYGESADSLSEQVITKSASEIVSSGGVYSWYIDKLEPKSYTFRIFWVKNDGSLIPDFSSEALTATIGTPGCSIENVGEITVKTSTDTSILSWLSVTGAVSYNIYKYTAAGDTEFLTNTKDTTYTIFLSSGSVVHEDFGIKALCDEKTESADISKVSKVQTGPGMIAFLVILSALLGIIFMRRKASY